MDTKTIIQKENKNIKLDIKSVTKDQKVIDQQTLSIQKHYLSPDKEKFLILSKNDFGKNFRINAGIFNKKTSLVITNEHSLLVLDKEDTQIKEVQVKELINSNQLKENRYFMLYYLPIFSIEQNFFVTLNKENEENEEEFKVNLNFELGRALGKCILDIDILDNIKEKGININNDQKLFLKILLAKSKKEGKIDFDKRFLISSNYKFLLGILFELQRDQLYLENINIYLITSIFNMLGASYSIKKEENKFYIRFKLPLFYKIFMKKLNYLKNPKKNLYNIYNEKLKMIRNKKWIIKENKLELVSYNEFKDIYHREKLTLKNKRNNFESENNIELNELINFGLIELFPINDFIFLPAKENIPVYDFVTEGINGATNYSMPGLPLQKNSDGDILALVAIWTADAARDADKKFGMNKKTVLSQLTGKPFSWIAIDSIIGLYNFTK